MRLIKLFLYVLSIGAVGCSTGAVKSLDQNERITIEGDFMSKSYRQKDTSLSACELQENLLKIENTKSSAKKSRMWSYVMPAAAAIGGYFAISSVLNNSLTTAQRDQNLGVGVGMVGVALMSAYFTQNYLDSAVEVFNSKFPPVPSDEIPNSPKTDEDIRSLDESHLFFFMDLAPTVASVELRPTGAWVFRF